MNWDNLEERRAYNRAWHKKNAARLAPRKLAWYHAHKHEVRAYKRRLIKGKKRRVLTFYGHKHTLRCSWRKCTVVDLDCLTLDHVHNDGGLQRRRLKHHGGGSVMYAWIIRNNFPEGFRTLCANHQLKKEINRRGAK